MDVSFSVCYNLDMKRNMNKKQKTFAAILVIIAAAGAYLHFENTSLTITAHEISSEKIPQNFDGYEIMQISDLHNVKSSKLTGDLISRIKENSPDIAVITGDTIDSRHTDTEAALDVVRRISEVCPVYYVAGNHEARIDEYETFVEDLAGMGVHILTNGAEQIKIGDESINIVGIDDPDFAHEFGVEDSEIAASFLEGIEYDKDNYTVLLSHRPELIDAYSQAGVDLVFSGHAHGGQIRLPFVGGLIAPDQGLLPEYTSGAYEKGNTVMVVSRGIGNSIFPLRINNRPELVSVTLKSRQFF